MIIHEVFHMFVVQKSGGKTQVNMETLQVVPMFHKELCIQIYICICKYT